MLPEGSFSLIVVKELGVFRDKIDDAGPTLFCGLGVIVMHGQKQAEVG
jgi:hypothetical protein